MLTNAHQILIHKLKEHSRLSGEDVVEICSLSYSTKDLKPNEDLIRQGDDPSVSALVLSGLVARYHLLQNGGRQYLSFHMAGDMPDSQSLFIDQMDHAVCAIGTALVASLPHRELLALFNRRPSVGFAIWRETLIDAAIFREAITNNSARAMPARMAHLFCELFYRARASALTAGFTCRAPISLVQLGEALGMSIATVNRTLHELRASRAMDFQNGELIVKNWPRLAEIGEFDPHYLHLKKPALTRVSETLGRI
jgi:CRP-like cAMP-binding protein